MNVLADHHLVLKAEARRFHLTAEQLQRLAEVGLIETDRLRVGYVDRHAVASSRAACALPIVGGGRRHVAHEHRVERADIDSELERRRAHQHIELLTFALELVLDALALVVRNLRRVLRHAQHRVVVVEHAQIEVVLHLVLPRQASGATPSHA